MIINERDFIVLEAGRTEKNYWSDLWRYRELFYFMAWRDILVHYKQTIIGVAWSVIRLFLNMIALTVNFRQTDQIPVRRRTLSSFSIRCSVTVAIFLEFSVRSKQLTHKQF
jgi:ABC-type polysaccharide/polyol phosphate export permease